MGAGDKLLLVSVACRHRKDAMAKVCLALEGLRLAVITANVTSSSGALRYTAQMPCADALSSCAIATNNIKHTRLHLCHEFQ